MIGRHQIRPAKFRDADRRQRLVAACSAVKPIFERYLVEGDLAGMSFGVVIDSELVLSSGVGTLTIGSSDRPDADSIFRIASMTKSFTAAAVLYLRDSGKLRLDDPISIYVPEFDLLTYPTGDSAKITVRDLLTMSSGWPQDDPWADRQLYRSDNSISHLFKCGVSFSNPPGIFFEYSNYGYMVLGRVISRAAEEPAIDYIERILLKPLGMDSTCWHATISSDRRRAQGYRWEDEVWREEQFLVSGGDGVAFGGLYSTVRDLSRWVGLFQSSWPPRTAPDNGPLRRSSLREMQQIWRIATPKSRSRKLGTQPEVAYGYGYGLSVSHSRGRESVGHSGGLPGFGSHMEWIPAHGIGVIALANVTYSKVRSACLDALDELISAADSCPRIPDLAPALESAHNDLCQLLNKWDETLADRLFADNFFLDSSRERWKVRLAELSQVHGRLRARETIDAENWLRGQRRLHGERGWCHVWISLSPTVPPQVQTLKINSVLPPSLAMSETAEKIVGLTGHPVRSAFDKLLSPECDCESIWNQLQLASIMYGQCALNGEIQGDGECWAVFRLNNKDQSILLELHIHSDGKIVKASFTAEIVKGDSCFE